MIGGFSGNRLFWFVLAGVIAGFVGALLVASGTVFVSLVPFVFGTIFFLAGWVYVGGFVGWGVGAAGLVSLVASGFTPRPLVALAVGVVLLLVGVFLVFGFGRRR